VTDLEQDDRIETASDIHRSRQFIECPRCYRLWVQLSATERRFVPFTPEEEPLRLAEQQGGYRG